MSVYRRMLGRELPARLGDMLAVPALELAGQEVSRLAREAREGSAGAVALYKLGLWNLTRGEFGLARRRLCDALTKAPGLHEARLALAGVCEALARHDEAAAHIDSVMAISSPVEIHSKSDVDGPWAAEGEIAGLGPYRVLCAAGFAHERAGDSTRALERYSSALAAGAGADLFALHRMVAIHLARGQVAEARDALRELLLNCPQDQGARVCVAHLLGLEGRYREAVWEYEQALCLEPDSWELPASEMEQLSACAQDAGRAMALLVELVRRQPQFPDLRMRLGDLYSDRGDDARALGEYHAALAMHPEYLDCHISLARHERRMGRPEQACLHLGKAIAINNRHVDIYVGLAVAQRRLGREAQAGDLLDSASRIANNSAVLMARLSGASEDELDAGTVQRQIEAAQHVLAARPSWTDVRVRVGLLLRLAGRTSEATEQFEIAARGEPACREAWMHWGLSLRAGGVEAWEPLEQSLLPDGKWITLNYQVSLASCGELEFDLAMDRLEDSPELEDVERQVNLAIEAMELDTAPAAIGPIPATDEPRDRAYANGR